jgi:energy-coupling factor transport system ATP-binding protein
VSDAAIRLEGVRYQYAGTRTWALDGVDLSAGAGEIVGLVGPNDAGKSTVCLVAAALAPAVTGGRLEGQAWLVDGPTAELPAHEAARRCGVLFQNPLAQLSGTAATVWEEIAFGPRNVGLERRAIAERVARSLELLRIAHLAPRDPGRLSGGQAQLVAMASVLALEPRALVLDEPTSQLDPEGTRLVGEAIRRVAGETGSGVLIVEHKTALLATIADRVTVLAQGRTVLTGATRDVLADVSLTELGVDPPADVRIGRAIAAAGLPVAITDRAVAAIAEASAR